MIEVIHDDGVSLNQCPSEDVIIALLQMTCGELQLSNEPELCIRFATDKAVLELNTQWRDKATCTDVLSFPQQDGPDFVLSEPLGDIVIAVSFVHQEAARLELSPEQHILHLIIHGFLHLLAYDHQDEEEAMQMQHLESVLMQKANLHCPYPEFSHA